jgi:pantothenate kinase
MATLQDLVARARVLIAASGRRVLGITGSPGAGKTTLCTALVDALGQDAVLVGMDGFHLANEELKRLGRRDRKGAPDTFDVDGYIALLRRLRSQEGRTIYAPSFDRRLDESIGCAVPVHAETPLVLTEGNYLLRDRDGWEAVRDCLDEVWFLQVSTELRRQRLVRRHQAYGASASEATAWVDGVDELNAAVVAPTRAQADLVVDLATGQGDSDTGSTTSPPTKAPTAKPDATTNLGKEN